MRIHEKWLFCLVLSLVVIAYPWYGAQAKSQLPLTIISQAESVKEHHFKVEFAETQEDQERGLMFRTSLPLDSGMLFDFGEVKIAKMWMRNTLIPLDMLFIDADKRVVNIIHKAEPKTLTSRRSISPVRWVLELNGGIVKQKGIKAGDRVVFDYAEIVRETE